MLHFTGEAQPRFAYPCIASLRREVARLDVTEGVAFVTQGMPGGTFALSLSILLRKIQLPPGGRLLIFTRGEAEDFIRTR